MGKYYIWQCVHCRRKVKWDGESDKPDSTCKGTVLKKHKRVQMPLKEIPKK